MHFKTLEHRDTPPSSILTPAIYKQWWGFYSTAFLKPTPRFLWEIGYMHINIINVMRSSRFHTSCSHLAIALVRLPELVTPIINPLNFAAFPPWAVQLNAGPSILIFELYSLFSKLKMFTVLSVLPLSTHLPSSLKLTLHTIPLYPREWLAELL